MNQKEIIDKFQKSSMYQKLSDNQQKFTERVLTSFLAANEHALSKWTPNDVTEILTGEFATNLNEPHNFYVAVTPILSSFFKFAETETTITDGKAFIKAAKGARDEMLNLSSTNSKKPAKTSKKAEKPDTTKVVAEDIDVNPAQVGDEVDSWLDEIHKVPVVSNLTAADLHYFDVIVDSVSELMILGMKREPDTWDTGLLAEVMFRRFVPILEEDEKTSALFEIVPFGLSELIKHLARTNALTNDQELLAWVREHHDGLTSLYDKKFDNFYTNLTQAMKQAGVDTTNRDQVNAFTQYYLSQNGEEGKQLYAGKTKKSKAGQQLAFRKKGRRKKKRH